MMSAHLTEWNTGWKFRLVARGSGGSCWIHAARSFSASASASASVCAGMSAHLTAWITGGQLFASSLIIHD